MQVLIRAGTYANDIGKNPKQSEHNLIRRLSSSGFEFLGLKKKNTIFLTIGNEISIFHQCVLWKKKLFSSKSKNRWVEGHFRLFIFKENLVYKRLKLLKFEQNGANLFRNEEGVVIKLLLGYTKNMKYTRRVRYRDWKGCTRRHDPWRGKVLKNVRNVLCIRKTIPSVFQFVQNATW